MQHVIADINAPLAFYVGLKRLYFFIMSDYDSNVVQHKVGIVLMCPFVMKLLRLIKICMWWRARTVHKRTVQRYIYMSRLVSL